MLRIRDWARCFETHESKKLQQLNWVRLSNDLRDLGYLILIQHPEGAAHFGAWVAIVEIASRCKTRGTLIEGVTPLTAQYLSLKSGLPVTLFESAIPRLLEIGWLEGIPDISGNSPDTSGESADETGEFPDGTVQTSAYITETLHNTDKNSKPLGASGDARLSHPELSIDEPPFDTVGPVALFPVEPKKATRATGGLNAQQEIWFTEWWAGYWLKKAKKAARQAFGKHVATAARFEQVMAAMKAQEPEMQKREPQHRPHGATWLNGERWTDETVESTPKRNERDEALDRMYASLDQEKEIVK